MRRLSAAVEDYLKAIYELEQEIDRERVPTTALAAKLGVANASVTGMLKKLAAMRPRLVDYKPYRGVRLTPRGRKVALEIIRHHRLLETYLSQALGYGWDEVHQEADRLEHVISEELEERIARFLGHPRVDPHGHPIPARDGSLPEKRELRLTDLEVGRRARVSRVSDRDPDLLRYLDRLGLRLNAPVEVVDRGPFEGPLHVRLLERDEVHALSRQVTDQVFVSTQNQDP